MHLVCLGVTRKLLNLWVSGKFKAAKLSENQINLISKQLEVIKPYIPSDFNRTPRDLNELPRWKATELKQFVP
jgi:hypothetical protein